MGRGIPTGLSKKAAGGDQNDEPNENGGSDDDGGGGSGGGEDSGGQQDESVSSKIESRNPLPFVRPSDIHKWLSEGMVQFGHESFDQMFARWAASSRARDDVVSSVGPAKNATRDDRVVNTSCSLGEDNGLSCS